MVLWIASSVFKKISTDLALRTTGWEEHTAASLTLPTYINCFSSIKSFLILAMDSCHRNNISLGGDKTWTIHFVLPRGRKISTGLEILSHHKIAICILQLITVFVNRKKKFFHSKTWCQLTGHQFRKISLNSNKNQMTMENSVPHLHASIIYCKMEYAVP